MIGVATPLKEWNDNTGVLPLKKSAVRSTPRTRVGLSIYKTEGTNQRTPEIPHGTTNKFRSESPSALRGDRNAT